MKRFVFRLEKLLDLRRGRAEAQSVEVARDTLKLRDEESCLERLTGQHSVGKNGLRRSRTGVLDPRQIMRSQAHNEWLRGSIDTQTGRLTEAEEAVADEQRKLNEMIRDKKLIEKLRERKREEHRRENLRLEINQLDETGAVRHQINKSEEIARAEETRRD